MSDDGLWHPQGKPCRIDIGDDFTIRWAQAWNDAGDECLWVDFAIYEVTMRPGVVVGTGEPTPPQFPLPDARRYPDDSTAEIDKASPLIDGTVKWDGCTQWHQNDGAHVDSRRGLEALLGAIAEARRVAMTELLTTVDVQEY